MGLSIQDFNTITRRLAQVNDAGCALLCLTSYRCVDVY